MKNHAKIFWFMAFHTKLFLVQNHCVLDLMKWMELLEFIMGLCIWYYLALKNIILFTTELDML